MRPDGGETPTPGLALVDADDRLGSRRPGAVLTVYRHDRNRPGRLQRLLRHLTF